MQDKDKYKFLYYTWNENSRQDMEEGLKNLGHEVVTCQIPFKDYDNDSEFEDKLAAVFLNNRCDAFISFDFFPVVAKVATTLQKPYISWVYDFPHNTIYSSMSKSPYVKLFVFDRAQYEIMKNRKNKGLYHMPLAVNVTRLDRQLGDMDGAFEKDYRLRKNEELDVETTSIETAMKYIHDVSFIGSLYDTNNFRKINYLPNYLKGYIEGIIESQKLIYGCNFVRDMLTKDIVDELEKYVIMKLDDSYELPTSQLYADMINAEITARDRMELLAYADAVSDVTLYSGSGLPSFISDLDNCNIKHAGTVDYIREMPNVFRKTKINLNITLRSITSGIPLRALDIMGAGGFLLSNYQPELAERFDDGVDVVMFESPQDMCDKIVYYLNHDKEREAIAMNGYKKVRKEYSYEAVLGEMLSLAI